ncbi:MAG: hypothetical protein HKN76_08095 [Saprospiraceae bacterium]|nr:hypothetical protein [Saprospiraceae bacterium]
MPDLNYDAPQSLKTSFIGTAIVLISATIIAYELTLIQAFSFMQWHHFAFMIISMAILGFGVAGTVLTLKEEWFLKNYPWILPLLFFAFGIFMPSALFLINVPPLRFDTYLLFHDFKEVLKLLLTYLIVFIPFFFGGLAIGLTFDKIIKQINTLYFLNLAGSGIGGLIFLALIWQLSPSQITGVLGLLSIAGGWMISARPGFSKIRLLGLISTIIVIIFCWFPPQLSISQFKALNKILLLPDSHIFLEKNSPFGLIQAVKSPNFRYAPGLSLNYENEIAVHHALFQNGDWYGAIIPLQINKEPVLDYTTSGVAYYVDTPKQILLLSSGTGEGIGQAIFHEAEHIVAVESNQAVINLLTNELADLSDSLFQHPAVTLITQDARTYLSTDTSLFSLIVTPGINVFGGTSGINSIQETYLLTKDAVEKMLHRLHSDGLISATTWLDYPLRDPLKLLATFVEVMEEKNLVPIEDHLIAIKSWGTITFLLKNRPFTRDEIFRTRSFCQKHSFDPVLLPDLSPSDIDQYHQSQDTQFYHYIEAILSPDRGDFYDDYDFHVEPATDDRPFFYQNLRWNSFSKLAEMYSWQGLSFLAIGHFLIYLTFGQIILIALILIIIPLFLKQTPIHNKTWTFLYFGGIGLGYLFVEIVLIQQYLLYVGHTVYAATAVISLLLISSGVGSYYSSHLILATVIIRKWLLIIALTLLLYSFLLTPILQSTVGVHWLTKIIILILLTCPLGFIMGIPFPLGLSFIHQKTKGSVPWAWGINGYFSVISSSLATIIAIEWGFSWLFLMGALAYLVALTSSWTYLYK